MVHARQSCGRKCRRLSYCPRSWPAQVGGLVIVRVTLRDSLVQDLGLQEHRIIGQDFHGGRARGAAGLWEGGTIWCGCGCRRSLPPLSLRYIDLLGDVRRRRYYLRPRVPPAHPATATSTCRRLRDPLPLRRVAPRGKLIAVAAAVAAKAPPEVRSLQRARIELRRPRAPPRPPTRI